LNAILHPMDDAIVHPEIDFATDPLPDIQALTGALRGPLALRIRRG
jgi:hypothetical protein